MAAHSWIASLISPNLLNISSTSYTSILPFTNINTTRGTETGIVIENCGSHERDLQYLILETIRTIDYAHEDTLRYGDGSDHGFQAMFKSSEATRTVLTILSYMRSMNGLLGLRPAPKAILCPRFACVDEGSNKKYEYLKLGFDPQEQCNSIARNERPMHGFYAQGTAYVFLCESFWDLQSWPQDLDDRSCPGLVGNRFHGDQDRFHRRYRLFEFVNLMDRFYLGRNVLDAKSIPREVFKWDDCVFKVGDEIESVLNPTNLELYVACKFVGFSDVSLWIADGKGRSFG